MNRLFWFLFGYFVAIWSGCSPTLQLASRIPPGAECHKKASEHIQMAKTCAEAQALSRAEESCRKAYPEGVDLECKEMP